MIRLTPSDPFRQETMAFDLDYDAHPSGAPYDWSPASRNDSEWDAIDFHLDLGCGKLKKGRIGLDRYAAEGVDIVFDLERFEYPDIDGGHGYGIGRLPFPDSSIKSIITHHMCEHIGDNFIPLMDDIYRVLEPDGILRAITPLFPSHTAVADPDHRRYFLEGTWESFCGTSENCWLESFSVPYTKARFTMEDKDITARLDDPFDWWTEQDAREIRVALRAGK